MAEDLSGLHKQGAEFYGQKKYPEAIAALEKAVESEDPHSAAYVNQHCTGPELSFSNQPRRFSGWKKLRQM